MLCTLSGTISVISVGHPHRMSFVLSLLRWFTKEVMDQQMRYLLGNGHRVPGLQRSQAKQAGDPLCGRIGSICGRIRLRHAKRKVDRLAQMFSAAIEDASMEEVPDLKCASVDQGYRLETIPDSCAPPSTLPPQPLTAAIPQPLTAVNTDKT